VERALLRSNEKSLLFAQIRKWTTNSCSNGYWLGKMWLYFKEKSQWQRNTLLY